jgi:hypothetical protein
MWRCCAVMGLLLLLTGCESTHEHLLAEGYPPAFADGFDEKDQGAARAYRSQ